MTENSKIKESSFYKDDIIRIIIILIVILGFMIITWVKADRNYRNQLLEEQNKYTHVLNNSLYKYDIVDNNILFYDLKNNLVSSYHCNSKCSLMNSKELSFSINNDSLIIIKDNNKYVLYNILNKKTDYTFDIKPVALDKTDYAIVVNNNKYGVIDNNGNIKLNMIYESIKYFDGYFALFDNTDINILDTNFNVLNKEKIIFGSYNDIDISFDNNIFTITNNASSNNLIKYRFDVVNRILIED